MEGGQKFSVDLEAGLNINSSEMLVNVNQPTFQHNWQKYQGKYLSNSLRFEMNGWAAGWNVYNFKYNVFRKQLAENVWVQLSDLNDYIKVLDIYNSKDSEESLAQYIVIPKTYLISGDGKLVDNKIRGVLNEKSFVLDLLDFSISDGFSVSNYTADNHTEIIKVVDTESSFEINFDLLQSTSLTGDSIKTLAYIGYEGKVHAWGDYVYDLSTGVLTTPEGIEVRPDVANNELSFEYDVELTDEKASLTYTFDTFYHKFTSIFYKDNSRDYMLIGDSPSEKLEFNYYDAYSEKTSLIAKDVNGVVVDWKLPLWASVDVSIKTNVAVSNALCKCNNTDGFNLKMQYTSKDNFIHTNSYNIVGKPAVKDIKLRWENAYDSAYNGDVNIGFDIFNLRVFGQEREAVGEDTSHNTIWEDVTYHKYTLFGRIASIHPRYRFNQFIYSNIMFCPTDWSPYRFKSINDVQLWYGTTKQYKNLREKNKSLLARYLGNIYTWGTFTYNPAQVFELNKPFNWADSSNCVYKLADISNILSVKLKGTADSIAIGDDYEFISGSIKPDFIAKVTGNVSKYASEQEFVSVVQAYTNGVYSYGTYEDADMDDAWVFSKVPKFNVILNSGERIKGVYWTDGVEYIDNLSVFKSVVLGERDNTIEQDNVIACFNLNDNFNRKRVVHTYRPVYDFTFYGRDERGLSDSEIKAKNSFEELWTKWYPNTKSPNDKFNNNIADLTYLNFTDIDVVEREPSDDGISIDYTTPGVNVTSLLTPEHLPSPASYDIYTFDDDRIWYTPSSSGIDFVYNSNVFLPFNNSVGLTISEASFGENINYDLECKVFHHLIDCSDRYTLNNKYIIGILAFLNTSIPLPGYFGNVANVMLMNRQIKIEGLVLGTGLSTDMPILAVATPTNIKVGVNYDTDWNATDADEHCWIKNLLLTYSNTGYNLEVAKLNDGVQAVSKCYSMADATTGIKIAWPVWGHSATRITYPEIKGQSEIFNAETFKIELVQSSDIRDKSLIYWDRSDTVKSVALFEVLEDSKNPDNFQQSGTLTLGLNPLTEDSCLFYAEKLTTATVNGTVETLYNAYVPGIAFGDVYSDTGHMMSIFSNLPKLKMTWTPVSYSVPIAALVTYVPTNSKKSQHRFFLDSYKLLAFEVEFGEFNPDTLLREITLIVNDIRISYVYDVRRQVTDYIGSETNIYSSDTESVTVTNISGRKVNADVLLRINLMFNNNRAKFVKVNYSSEPLVLAAAAASTVVLNTDKVSIEYNTKSKAVLLPKSNYTVTDLNNGVHVHLTADYSLDYNVSIKNVENGIYTFKFEDVDYSVDLAAFIDKTSTTTVTSTDIRTCKTKEIGKIKNDSQYQLLKQQWNTTTEVENFWWINDRHVLELNNSMFVLKRNTGKLDDWNGNVFEDVYRLPRAEFITSETAKYFVTNVYRALSDAIFVCLTESADGIKVTLYDVCKGMTHIADFYMYVHCVDLGNVLNEITIDDNNKALLNTYSHIDNMLILSKAEFSATIVDSNLILGVHLNKNFNQWAIVYNLDSRLVLRVIQGYGYVGLKGDLTGGQIPDVYVDVTKGFNGAVLPIESLDFVQTKDLNNLDAAYESSIESINDIKSKVVGIAEQQWYIQSKLHGVVSHLKYAGGQYKKELIPITNNFSAAFMSPSWASSLIGDNMVQVTPFSSLIKFPDGADTVWKLLMSVAGMPMIYSIAPRFAAFAYINMTFGQYAYVHYNSSKSLPRKEPDSDLSLGDRVNSVDASIKQTDPILSSEYSFDKQKFTQCLDTDLDTSQSLVLLLLIAFGDSLNEVADAKTSANEEVARTSTSDFGRIFNEHASENVSDLLASNLVTKSRNTTGISGAVTGLKSLDMFYSTCDEQEVYAGPGFVEHKFVADCVAQSSTVLHAEGKVFQFYWSLSKLSLFQLEKQIQLINIAADNLSELSHNMESATGPLAVNYGAAIAAGLTASATALRNTAVIQQAVSSILKTILQDLSVKGLESHLDRYISRHNLSVEGKHKYGEKSETFMWPCWGIKPGSLKYTDESVIAGVKNTPWYIRLDSRLYYKTARLNYVTILPMSYNIPRHSSALGTLSDFYRIGSPDITDDSGSMDRNACIYRAAAMSGKVPFYQAVCYGDSTERKLPDDMSKIEGVKNFLPRQPFKNENISASEPVFSPSMFQDYKIDEYWDLGMCCTYGMQQWVTCKDTKLTSCPPSNIFVTKAFCGVATPYSAIEIKRSISKEYMRPWTITPNALAFNCTGYNSIFDDKLYHAFDGISYRLVDWVGSPGMNKNFQTMLYSFQKNDRFKRSNKFPANEVLGNFNSEPAQALDTIDEVFTLLTVAAKEKGLEAGVVGEDKDLTRWSLPIFTEPVTTLPAVVRTLTAVPLVVADGITCLVTDLANNQAAYKAPISIDFTIGKNVYRQTEDYICSVQTVNGVDSVVGIVPSLGLKFIGSTPTEAYFYSEATRYYYIFSGTTLVKMDMMERFRSVQKGYWDFVNQEVIMPCLMTFKRFNPEVLDTDTETDNIIVPQLSKGQVTGEIAPPLTTIFNDKSWYKCVSLPSGFAYQGPNRVIINRNVFIEYMLDTLKENLGKWERVSREKYAFKRRYKNTYTSVASKVSGVEGWTHNPFLLVTSPLGLNEGNDCLFEWEITFCWPVEMDLIYGPDNYACVNIAAETMSSGGKLKSRPTHVYLTKELFTCNGSYGYYTFRYQSKNGSGNCERLSIWSDQYIAVSKLECECKIITSKRTEQLTQQLNVQRLKEL